MRPWLLALLVLPLGTFHCEAQVGAFSAVLREVDRTVTQALSEQRTNVQAKASAVSAWPKNPATANIQADLQKTDSALQKAELSASGVVPQSRRDLIISVETIRTKQRPVWALCNSDTWLSKPDLRWASYFESVKEPLVSAASSVGMFVLYTAAGQWIQNGATGFVVSDRLLVTNRHVLSLYATKDGAGSWRLNAGRRLTVQFPFEYEKCNQRRQIRELKVVDIVEVGTTEVDDFAILAFESDGQGGPAIVGLAPSFRLAGGARVAAIGYPGRPVSCGDDEPTPDSPCTFLTETQIDTLFKTPDEAIPFPAERISPGVVLVNPALPQGVFSYDSSTWGGSSGSPVVSLVDGKVIGIQSQGASANEEGVSYNNGVAIDRILPALTRAKEKLARGKTAETLTARD